MFRSINYKSVTSVFATVLVSFVSLSSCEEDINLDCDTEASRIVIDGHICDMVTRYNFVRLTMSNPYFSNIESPAVSGATVTISDGVNEYDFCEESLKGYYFAPEFFIGEHGKTYVLKVVVDSDNDGELETYTASEPMPATHEVDSAACRESVLEGMYQLELYAPEDTESEDYYMFGMSYNDSLCSDTFIKFESTDDKSFTNDYCWGSPVYMFDDEYVKKTITPGDKVTMHALSINKGFYKYDQAVDDIFEGSTPMFSSAPANAVGNVSGGALGYFAVFAVVNVDCYVQ